MRKIIISIALFLSLEAYTQETVFIEGYRFPVFMTQRHQQTNVFVVGDFNEVKINTKVETKQLPQKKVDKTEYKKSNTFNADKNINEILRNRPCTDCK